MTTSSAHQISIYVHKSRQQWIVRDPAGDFWIMPSFEHRWHHREPSHLFCDNVLQIAVNLATTDPDSADMALKFVQHYLWIASSMVNLGGGTGMWDEEDGFFYDVLRLPDGHFMRLKVHSMVGLLPLCAATTFDDVLFAKYPELQERSNEFLEVSPRSGPRSTPPP